MKRLSGRPDLLSFHHVDLLDVPAMESVFKAGLGSKPVWNIEHD